MSKIITKPKKNLKSGLIILGLIFLLLLAGCKSSSPLKCSDMECFISNANQCKAATYEEVTDFGKISYIIKADDTGNCLLTKEIVELSENEDAVLKKALEGKKMECIYSSGQFNGQWLTSMIEGLEDCRGELKEAVGQLLLLV